MFEQRDRSEQAAVLALVAHARGEWHLVSQLLEEVGSAQRVLAKDWSGFETAELVDAVDYDVSDDEVRGYERLIDQVAAEGAALVTVLDRDYPTNLRLVYNRPPFLFVRGALRPEDERAVAVVGTRRASEGGREQAARLAMELSERDVVVLSGLAIGIDTAAHLATLEAGGRTIAVMGTGIRRLYPAANRGLADRIVAAGGALVSQFWPDGPPTKWSFPMRNAVMSGMAVGTVVVEASGKSGARMQARLALEHGKRLFLVESLVMQEEWARRYAERPGATVVESAVDVVAELDTVLRPVSQLTFG